MRRGEILALRWPNINFEDRWISINQSVVESREEFRLKDVKTKGSKRRISIAPFLVDELVRVKARQSEVRIRLGMGKDTDGLVFTNLDGSMRKPSLVTAEFGKLIRKLDITQTSFQGLRHSHISHLLQDGNPVKTVSHRVGHSSAAMTLDRYGHLMPDAQEDLAAGYGAELELLMEQAENE
jgi:integrase